MKSTTIVSSEKKLLESIPTEKPHEVSKRNLNLDVLRAAAILMVIIFHVVQMSPEPLPLVMEFAQFGKYGVHLFFVLSGWLIGGLYWREVRDFGKVELMRFWMRRWLRTIPPYLVVFVISWLAVWFARREPFDFGYFIFLQNYYSEIPFFLVSWSLCIEEHFYLFVPLLLHFLPFRKPRFVSVVFLSLVLVAPLSRFWISLDGLSQSFGFEATATHFHMEGLLIGFWLSYLSINSGRVWNFLQKISPLLIVISFVVVCVSYAHSVILMYNLGLTAVAIGFSGVLIYFVDRQPAKFASMRWVQWGALTSYSVYLVHPLIIHFSREVIGRLSWIPWWCYFPMALVLIALGGAFFYFLFERSSIILRDILVPRRVEKS